MRSGKVVLVQCTNEKRDGTHPARDLYDESTYFRKQRAYAESVSRFWFIQSAKYGLVPPDRIINSYDKHAKEISDPDAWATEIADDLSNTVNTTATIEILGGTAYSDPLRPELEAMGYDVVEPLRGLGIGERMSWLDAKTTGGYHATIYG